MAIRPDTKRLLAASLETLLSEKPLSMISTNDIVKHAGASRTTFYRHFRDKYELMNWVYKDTVDRILACHPDIRTWREWLAQVLRFVQSKSDYFQRIISYREQNSFTGFLLEYSYRYCRGKIEALTAPAPIDRETEYALRIYTAGCSYITEQWIRHGCVEPYEELASLMCKSIPEPMRTYFG